MPIKRGGKTRSNAGRFAPEGKGATQRGRGLKTPSGRERPMQTARLPRASMPGTVTPSGAARTSSVGRGGGGGAMSRLSVPLAIAAEVMKPRPTAKAELTPEMKKRFYEENKGRRQLELRDQQMKADKGSFDDAFSMARKTGREEFSWRGRKYNTKMK
jgi:hypothetical protein